MSRLNIYDQVRANKIKSVLIFLFFIILVSALGYLVGFVYGSRYFGLGLALIAAIIYGLIAYYSGSKMVLAMTGARPVTKKEFPHLYHSIEGLSIAANIPKPKAYVIDDSALNAFATGVSPKKAAVTVTTGLLNKLNRQELEGVIAHEISHIKNYDIRFMLLSAVMVGVVVLISDFMLHGFLWGKRDREGSGNILLIVIAVVLAILAPIFAEMIKLAVSRKREYLADAQGALLTRYPPGLASALEKIKGDPDPLVDKANKATAHLFISTPFRKKKRSFARFFSTHPPIDERIKRLKKM